MPQISKASQVASLANDIVSVKDFGAVGDGVTDDTAAFLSLLNQSGELVIPVGIYKLTAGLEVDAYTQRLVGQKATLDFSSMTGSYTAIQLNGTNPSEPYGQNAGGLEGLTIIGDSKTGSGIGILEQGTGVGSNAASSSVKNCNVSFFGKGRVTSTNGYLIKWYNSSIFRCGVGYEMVTGGSNYGEGMSFFGCSIYNNDLALNLSNQNATVQLASTSLDYNYSLINMNGGTLNLTDCHIEFDGTAQTATPFIIGSNESMFVMKGGVLLSSTSGWTQDYVVDCTAPSRVVFDGVRIFRMASATAFDTGTGEVFVVKPYINTVSQVTPWRSRGELWDASFETGTISSNTISITSDTASITNPTVGTNLELTLDTNEASQGTQSLRAAKLGGGNSAFSITVPANEGDMFAIRFKCKNNNSQPTGNIFATHHFSKHTGSDANAVPLITKDAAHGTAVFSPTNVWTQYQAFGSLQGGSRCPRGRNALTFEINMVNFTGGTGAPEGGNYSLYFDEIEIYRWGS